jgi:hypothetical protein
MEGSDMNSMPLRWNQRVRTLMVAASVAATLIMGVVTLAEGASKEGASPVVSATGPTSTRPPLVIAAPTRMKPEWQGGGWIGMGPFHGQGWPGR